jgi:hypothetical protein
VSAKSLLRGTLLPGAACVRGGTCVLVEIEPIGKHVVHDQLGSTGGLTSQRCARFRASTWADR